VIVLINARSFLAGSANHFLLALIELSSTPIPYLALIQPSHTDTTFSLNLRERALHELSPIFIELIITRFAME
jgi:hypothetical protein